MAFAQEIKDFLDAYKTVSGVLSTNERDRLAGEELGLRKQSLASEDAWRRSQIKKNEWDMGADDREAGRIIQSVGGGKDTFGSVSPVMGDVSAYSTGAYNAPALEQAFADVESAGGDWGAVGPTTKKGNRAYGKYQVMDFNIPTWTQAYYGEQLTPKEFLGNKEAQQAVFHGEMKRLVGEYGNVKDAASVWFTGEPYKDVAGTDRSDGYIDVDDYVSRVAGAYEKYSGEGQLAAATGEPVAQGDIGDVDEELPIDTSGRSAVPGINFAPGHSSASNIREVSYPDYWDETQTAAADGVNPDLLRVVTRASEIAGFPLGLNTATVDGIETAPGMRTAEQQAQFVKAGWSKTNNSKHLKGRATDLVPLVDGKPMDADQVTDEQWNAINAAMTKASEELGVPVEWGGNWKGFVDKPHYQLSDDYVGTETPTGLYNPDIQGPPVDDQSYTPPDTSGIQASGDAEVAPEAPAAPAIPEEGGYDPLPQTSGHTDAVSQSSHDAVQFALNDRSTPITTILKGAIRFGKDAVGVKPKAVDDGEPDPAADAYADGVGGAPIDLIAGLEKAVEERYGPMTQDRKTLEVMSTIYNYWMRQGKPEKAEGAVFAIYQSYKVMAQKTLALSQVAAEEGDIQDAAEKFAAAYSLVPDGYSMAASVAEDGTVVMTLTNEKTGEKTERRADPEDLVSQIMGITPDQFDDLVEERLLGADAEAEQPVNLPNLDEVIGGSPVTAAPTGTEEAIPEVPGSPGVLPTDPAAKDDVISSLPNEVPAGTEDVPGVETGEPAPTGGVQAGDKIVTKGGPTWHVVGITNADTGANTLVLQKEGDESNVIPFNEEWLQKILSNGGEVVKSDGGEAIPTDDAGVSEMGDAEVAPADPPYPTPIENAPSKPMTEEQFNAWAQKNGYLKGSMTQKELAAYDVARKLWESRTKTYNDWLALQDTAESDAAKAALSTFFKTLQDTPADQMFNPDESLYPLMGDKMASEARLAAAAHNAQREQALKEATEAETATKKVAADSLLQEVTKDYIPRSSEFSVPDPDTYGESPTDVSGLQSGRYTTPVRGAIPVEGEQVPYPSEDDRILGLEEDRSVFDTRLEKANEGIVKENEKFVYPKIEMTPEVEATTRTNLKTSYDTFTTKLISQEAQGDPQAKQTYGWIINHINNTDLQDEVLDTALIIKAHNDGLSEQGAIEQALGMMTFDPGGSTGGVGGGPRPAQPTESLFTATRLRPGNGLPAGMVRVSRKDRPDESVVMPEDVFVKLDNRRQEVANAYIGQKRAGIIKESAQRLGTSNLNQKVEGVNDAATAERQQAIEEEMADPSMEIWSGEGGGLQVNPEDR